MKVEILIVSYAHDIPYLRYCLRSIRKFASGFNGVTLVVPEDEYEEFHELMIPGDRLRSYKRNPDKAKWHLHAQVQKCLADVHCKGVDFILHTDSDCIFTEPVTPADYFVDGNPVLLIEPYSNLKDCPWKEVTEKVIGERIDWETMRRHPQVNSRALYSDFRRHVSRVHQAPFEQWVLSQKPTFPWGFSEHNALGAFAWNDPVWHGMYHWIDVSQDGHPPSSKKLTQFWSLSPPDKPQSTPWGKQCIPEQIINEILA